MCALTYLYTCIYIVHEHNDMHGNIAQNNYDRISVLALNCGTFYEIVQEKGLAGTIILCHYRTCVLLGNVPGKNSTKRCVQQFTKVSTLTVGVCIT